MNVIEERCQCEFLSRNDPKLGEPVVQVDYKLVMLRGEFWVIVMKVLVKKLSIIVASRWVPDNLSCFRTCKVLLEDKEGSYIDHNRQ